MILLMSFPSCAQSVGSEKDDSASSGQADPMHMDQNGDGKISQSEASGRMAEHFDVIDTNGDGFIDRDELISLRSRLGGKSNGDPGKNKGARREGAGIRNAFQHKGDFSISTIGTGCPVYNPERSGPSALIHYKGRYFLVDMGNGTIARLSEAGIPVRDIGTFMFTHHHLDHNEEFTPLFIKAYIPRRGNLKIIGPPRTKELCDFVLKFYGEDMAYRAGLAGLKLDGKKSADVNEYKGGDRFVLNGVTVSTAKVAHTIYTIAYRFDAEGKSIVISGDTSYSEGLIELAQGADVLVMDAGQVIKEKGHEWFPPFKSRKIDQTGGEKLPKPHGTLEEIATMAEKAQVKRMVLTHFTPGRVDIEATTKEIAEIYKGEILFGEDLMEIAP
jgi:ribonuclease BN (tRNA processing enzyme)